MPKPVLLTEQEVRGCGGDTGGPGAVRDVSLGHTFGVGAHVTELASFCPHTAGHDAETSKRARSTKRASLRSASCKARSFRYYGIKNKVGGL